MSTQEEGDRPVAFMFSGHSGQSMSPAFELYETEPRLREQIDLCAELLLSHLGEDLREAFRSAAGRQTREPRFSEIVMFVIEYALSRLLMGWGVRPRAMIGHGIGEYVAAHLSGVFCLEDALALATSRDRLMQRMPGGAAVVLPLGEEDARRFLTDGLLLSEINGPSLCVVSGSTDDVNELVARLTEAGVDYCHSHTSRPRFPMLSEPVLEPFIDRVKKVILKPPQTPYISTVTGTWITAAEATEAEYWGRHLRQTVRFAEGLEQLLTLQDCVLLEVGPGQVLSLLARRHPKRRDRHLVFSTLNNPPDPQSGEGSLLGELSQLWFAGEKIDWDELHKHKPRRAASHRPSFERQQSSRTEEDVAGWFYVPSWERIAPPEPSRGASRKSRWLVFSDALRIGVQLAERLKQLGQDVITVTAGEGLRKCGSGAYTINPGRREDYFDLIEELSAPGGPPQVIVHLWSITANDDARSGLGYIEESQQMGFYSLLFLAQAFGEHAAASPIQMEIVSNRLQAVTGHERLHPEKATLLGPCQVIPQEYPNITCRYVDIDLPLEGAEPRAHLVGQLIAEFACAPTNAVVAYRGLDRWVKTVEQVSLARASASSRRLTRGGVYMITGGLGGIALTLADHLARAAQARLILVGRSAFPDRQSWEQWLACHSPDEEISRKIRKLYALEQAGAELMITRADVSDLEAMREVINRATERFGEIRGVIHSAGVAGKGIIQLKTPQSAARVFAPKVNGALVLETLLKDTELDFFVSCSSLSSIKAIASQVDYSGANAFLDAFSHARSKGDGRLVTSINWDTWLDIGMAAAAAAPSHGGQNPRAAGIKQGILPGQGVDAFARILGARLPQVIVSPAKIPALK